MALSSVQELASLCGGLSLDDTKDQVTHGLLDTCINLIEDAEPRVRVAVAECLGQLANGHGAVVWNAVRQPLLSAIHGNWVRCASALCSSLLACSWLAGAVRSPSLRDMRADSLVQLSKPVAELLSSKVDAGCIQFCLPVSYI